MTTFNCLIMGAAGRDFHNFRTFFLRHPEFRVRAFTAAQIPFIEQRSFPRSLAGPHYEHDIPIHPEADLPELIRQHAVDFVFLAYSDLSHEEVMHRASLVQACGASFALLGPRATQLESTRPVVSVTAVRTGAGKSPLTQYLAQWLTRSGKRAAVLRHPMPYGDLERQAVERFATFDDLDRFNCTIEEREEFEPYLEMGVVVFAGVDYEQILRLAEPEAQVILWDGGNNDFSFLRPGLSIVVADALRPGHEMQFYPGETNFRMADVIVINKVSQARSEDVWAIESHAKRRNPGAQIIEADLVIEVSDPAAITDKNVLIIEDGPTLTHGGMSYGAGTLASRNCRARQIIDPRPHAVGSIADVFREHPHLRDVLPALGYSHQQLEELRRTIEATNAEVVIDASPATLERLIKLSMPVARVRYRFQQVSGPPLEELVNQFLESDPNTH
jgi:predicted GTPase